MSPLRGLPPEVQLEWQHGVRKQAGAGPRVSLTFRALKPWQPVEKGSCRAGQAMRG